MSEGWLESKVGGGTTDEGVMGRLIDEAFVMVERLDTLWTKITGQIDERLLAKSTECIEQDWGLNSEVVGP